MNPADFIAALLPAAQDCQKKLGIPASITLAQAAIESAWGERAIGNNLFGIKADSSWKGPVTMFHTHEVINRVLTPCVCRFRLYKTWADSIADHGEFLKANKRYAPCFEQTTVEGWAHGLQAAGYSTSPTYAETVLAVIHGRTMERYDKC